MRTVSIALLLVAPMILAGCTGEDSPPAVTGCPKPARAALNLLNPSNPIATWDTTLGCFSAELYSDKVPITAGNFVNLTKSGFYNGTRFHRVIEKFMIQDGDPYSKDPSAKDRWGQGDPGYDIPDEFRKDLRHSSPGTMSMANSGPNTGGSQYFITLVATPHLDGYDANGNAKKCGQGVSCHAVFGHIVRGQEVVDAIGQTPTDSKDRPTVDVVIRSVVLI